MRSCVVAISFLLLAAFAAPLAACPSCARAVADDTAAAAAEGRITVADGYNWSIYLMGSAPFLILGGFAGVLYRSYRRSLREEAASADGETVG